MPLPPTYTQVLEVVVGPAMSVAGSCEGVSAAGLLELPVATWQLEQQQQQQGQGQAGEASLGLGLGPSVSGGGDVSRSTSAPKGMYGMTWRQVYGFLRHHAAVRQWGLLGFLLFPGACDKHTDDARPRPAQSPYALWLLRLSRPLMPITRCYLML